MELLEQSALDHAASTFGVSVEAMQRVILTAQYITRVCLPAALENDWVQQFIANGNSYLGSYETEAKRRALIVAHPPLRLMFEHGHCFTEAVHPIFLPGSWSGGKSGWGEFLRIDPLKPDDQYSPVRPGWVWTSGNEAFVRRMNLKIMLGPGARKMVEDARRDPLYRFLAGITPEKTESLRLSTGLTPHEFWRAVKGKPSKEPALQQAALFPEEVTK